MKNGKIFSFFLAVLLLTGLLTTGCVQKNTYAPPPEQPPETVDEASPETGTAAALGTLKDFSAVTLEGEAFTVDNIAAKDVTVINFWALSCPPCIRELPDIADFSKALPDNVQVVTVCLDGAWDEEATRTVLSGAGFDGVTLLSGDGDFLALCSSLMYTPTTVFVDSEGTLLGDAIIGAQEDLSGTFLRGINTALAESGKAEISLAE